MCPADDGTEECSGESLKSVSGNNECEFVDSCETECDDSFEGESGDSWESEPETNDSLYIPTPQHQDKARPMDLSNKLGFIALGRNGKYDSGLQNPWVHGKLTAKGWVAAFPSVVIVMGVP